MMPARPDAVAVYRYSESRNRKDRPPYFSKLLALQSFVRAVQAADDRVHVVFVVDGPVDVDVRELMAANGEVRQGWYGSNRASYSHAVLLPRRDLEPRDLVWFAEDDYLYEEDSLVALLGAAAAIPEADWFALSGPTPAAMLEMRRAQGPVRIEPLDRPGGTVDVGGRPWRRIDSTTSTFGGRWSAVTRDARLLRLAPWSGAAWDRTTCLAVQGITPYPWRHVLSDLTVPSTPERHRAARVAWRLGTRIGMNLRSLRLPAHRSPLVAPVTPMVGHMNLPYEERAEHWDAVAREVAEWASTSLPRRRS